MAITAGALVATPLAGHQHQLHQARCPQALRARATVDGLAGDGQDIDRGPAALLALSVLRGLDGCLSWCARGSAWTCASCRSVATAQGAVPASLPCPRYGLESPAGGTVDLHGPAPAADPWPPHKARCPQACRARVTLDGLAGDGQDIDRGPAALLALDVARATATGMIPASW